MHVGVWHGACHSTSCPHDVSWSSVPSPSSPFALPSPFFFSPILGFSPVPIPELNCEPSSPCSQCSRNIISKGGALRSGKMPLGTLTVCLRGLCAGTMAAHLKSDFYEIFALICYQFFQMPFQYLSTKLYEIIVNPTAGG